MTWLRYCEEVNSTEESFFNQLIIIHRIIEDKLLRDAIFPLHNDVYCDAKPVCYIIVITLSQFSLMALLRSLLLIQKMQSFVRCFVMDQ